MPIQSRLPSDTSFDPDTIRILTEVFENAWRTVSGSSAVAEGSETARNRLARQIILLAQAGERDPAQLRDNAIAFMQEPR